MQKVINRVLHITQSFQQCLKVNRLEYLDPRLIKLTKVSENVEKKYTAAKEEAKKILYFHEEVIKPG